ncbi:hypothetical protein JYQ62_00960 [Nostoc sp. UHCC 0702]|nr:hypothetical protein JYQ62_00960 [Nostoc sp. UHCC 0702]
MFWGGSGWVRSLEQRSADGRISLKLRIFIMLHEFLLAERDEILALCSKKIARLADSMSSEKPGKALPPY